jgi:hypothetical protein
METIFIMIIFELDMITRPERLIDVWEQCEDCRIAHADILLLKPGVTPITALWDLDTSYLCYRCVSHIALFHWLRCYLPFRSGDKFSTG